MRALPWISTPILVVLLLAVWQIAVSGFGVSEFILPPPLEVWRSLVDLVSGSAGWHAVWVTLSEVLIGFAIALVVGMLFGAVLGRVVWLERAVQPAIVAFQVVPKVAFIPIFV